MRYRRAFLVSGQESHRGAKVDHHRSLHEPEGDAEKARDNKRPPWDSKAPLAPQGDERDGDQEVYPPRFCKKHEFVIDVSSPIFVRPLGVALGRIPSQPRGAERWTRAERECPAILTRHTGGFCFRLARKAPWRNDARPQPAWGEGALRDVGGWELECPAGSTYSRAPPTPQSAFLRCLVASENDLGQKQRFVSRCGRDRKRDVHTGWKPLAIIETLDP